MDQQNSSKISNPAVEVAQHIQNYQKYRGKCHEMSKEAVRTDPSLRLVRGYYYCPHWGKQPHWWTVRQDGSIYDPTKLQFPSKGEGRYEEFDGYFNCSECNKRIKEEDGIVQGNYIFCSNRCYGRFVGVYD